MKKFIWVGALVLFLIFLHSSFVFSGWYYAGGAASCETAKESNTGTATETRNFGNDIMYYWLASSFTATGTHSICQINAWLSKSASGGSGTVIAAIYDDSGGNPGSQVGTASDPVNVADLSTSETEEVFEGVDSGALVNTDTYWVVLKASAYDLSIYPVWHRIDGSGALRAWANTYWYNVSSTEGKFQLYSE